MCQKCQDAIREFFPNASDEEIDFVLWNLTPFPFGSPDDIREALKKAAEDKAARRARQEGKNDKR